MGHQEKIGGEWEGPTRRSVRKTPRTLFRTALKANNLARSLNTIVKKLEVQSLIDFLVQNFQNSGLNLSTETRNRFSKLLFDARSAYDELHADPTTSKILESLQINLIFEVGRLGKMIAALGSAQNFGALMQPAIYPDFANFQYSLQALANTERTCSQFLESERLGQVTDADELLELQLVSFDETGLTPERLVQFVETVNQLNTNFARVLGIAGGRLRIVYLESGSDDIFGFKSAKEIVLVIKELIFEVWDKVKYSGFERFEKKAEVLGSGLKAMALIDAAVTNNVITPEDGSIIKQHLLNDVQILIGIGATLPTNQEVVEVDQRKLLMDRRNARLLGEGEKDKGEPT